MLGELPMDTQGAAKTPASSHLFMKLVEYCWKRRHNCSIIYGSGQSAILRKQDIETSVVFLCTRVNTKKLTRLMQYLCSTQKLTLTIGPNDHPSWWVDSSNVIHLDMRSYIGIYMNLGKGVMYSG